MARNMRTGRGFRSAGLDQFNPPVVGRKRYSHLQQAREITDKPQFLLTAGKGKRKKGKVSLGTFKPDDWK